MFGVACGSAGAALTLTDTTPFGDTPAFMNSSSLWYHNETAKTKNRAFMKKMYRRHYK